MSHLVDQTYDVYIESTVVARKPHRCSACRETVNPGHNYIRVRIVFDGSANTVKRCLRCQAIHKHLRGLSQDSDVWPDERLSCGQDYESEWGRCPDEIAELAFKTGADLQEPR